MDDVQQWLAPTPAGELVAGEFRRMRLTGRRVTRDMRGQAQETRRVPQRVVVGQRLWVDDVEYRAEPLSLQFGEQRVGIDDRTAGGVDDERTVAQAGEGLAPDQSVRRLGQGCQHDDRVGFRQQVEQRIGAVQPIVLAGANPDHARADRLQVGTQPTADRPHPDDEHGPGTEILDGAGSVPPRCAGVLEKSGRGAEQGPQDPLGDRAVPRAAGVAQRHIGRDEAFDAVGSGGQHLNDGQSLETAQFVKSVVGRRPRDEEVDLCQVGGVLEGDDVGAFRSAPSHRIDGGLGDGGTAVGGGHPGHATRSCVDFLRPKCGVAPIPPAARRASVPGVLTRRGLLKGQLAAGAGYLAAAGLPSGLEATAAAAPTVTLHPNFYPLADFTPAIDLAGKVAVITGASSGIGRATGEALAAHGVHVIGSSRDAASVHRPPKFPLLDLDIADAKSAAAFVKKLRRRVGQKGRVDIVINNAGRGIVGNPVPPASGASRYFEQLDLGIRTDYSGHVMMTERLRPFLPARGYARVYFTVSIDAYSVSTNAMALFHGYTSMKRALLAFANAWWSQLRQAHSHIGVATVNPYLVDTRFPDNVLLLERPRPGSALAAYVQALKRSFAGSLPPSLVGQAYLQLLSSAQPPVNVAAGSAAEPYASRGTNSLFALELQVENAQAAIRFEAG